MAPTSVRISGVHNPSRKLLPPPNELTKPSSSPSTIPMTTRGVRRYCRSGTCLSSQTRGLTGATAAAAASDFLGFALSLILPASHGLHHHAAVAQRPCSRGVLGESVRISEKCRKHAAHWHVRRERGRVDEAGARRVLCTLIVQSTGLTLPSLGVGDSGVVELERLKLGECFEGFQSGVDGSVAQLDRKSPRPSLEAKQPYVVDFGPRSDKSRSRRIP